jgi:hypothetical protein
MSSDRGKERRVNRKHWSCRDLAADLAASPNLASADPLPFLGAVGLDDPHAFAPAADTHPEAGWCACGRSAAHVLHQPRERAESVPETPEREPDGLGDRRFIVVRLDGSQPAPTHASLLTAGEAQYEAGHWRRAALRTGAPWKFGVFEVSEVTPP